MSGSLSIRGLVVLVAVVAANLALIQFVFSFTWPDLWPQVVPMGLALQFAAVIAWRRRERGRPYAFWAGFLVCGGLAWLTLPQWWYMPYWVVGDYFQDFVYKIVDRSSWDAIDRWQTAWSWPEKLRFYEDYVLVVDAVSWTLPLLALGILGGVGAWAGRRLVAMTLDRRGPGRVEDSGG